MARLEELPQQLHSGLAALSCPTFETFPWQEGPPLKSRRVAIISTAGLHSRNERPFTIVSDDYRTIPASVKANDLVMSHVSANFDRSGFQQDLNLIFPIDRLKELDDAGLIGSVADFHYSFMGAADPLLMASSARNLAGNLKKDNVNAVLLIPV